MERASLPDRLAGSYPYLTMMATATCGWLMARQYRAAGAMLAAGDGDAAFLTAKQTSATFYNQQILPQALGLANAAMAGDTAMPPVPLAG